MCFIVSLPRCFFQLLDKSNDIYITVYVHNMVEFHLKCSDFPSHFLASQEVVFVNAPRRISSDFFFSFHAFFYSAIVNPEIDRMAD